MDDLNYEEISEEEFKLNCELFRSLAVAHNFTQEEIEECINERTKEYLNSKHGRIKPTN